MSAIDPRDAVVFDATPLLAQPRYGRLPVPVLGGYRFVAGSNGLFIQGMTEVLAFSLPVSPVRFPYGRVRSFVSFRKGPLPRALLTLARDLAQQACPNEWAGLIVFDADRGYRLVEPPVLSVSATRISYDQRDIDPMMVALDLHSHGHGPAQFSATDDEHDRCFIKIAGVFGHCSSLAGMTYRQRLCCHGHFIDLTEVMDERIVH